MDLGTSKCRYTTNHPKDVAARQMLKLAQSVKNNGCTSRELNNPTEHNIQKCMHEMKNITGGKSGEEFKANAKFLGENSNIEKHRRV